MHKPALIIAGGLLLSTILVAYAQELPLSPIEEQTIEVANDNKISKKVDEIMASTTLSRAESEKIALKKDYEDKVLARLDVIIRLLQENE